MAKILIIANANSPLTRARGVVGQQAGHQIFWVSTPKVDLPNVTAFGPSSSGRLTRILREPIALLSAIRRVQPDLVHVHYARQGLRTPILLRCRPLVVSTMGGDILPEQGYNGIHVPLVRALLNHADCITSKSEFLDAALSRIGNYRSKIRRVTWGIDLDRFCPGRDVVHLRAQWNIPPTDLVFFDVRGGKPFYNKHVIMAAFASYLQTGGPPATLLVAEPAAEPAYVARLKQQAHDLEIADRVRFVGAIDHAAMPDYYALADVTISIPRSDGLPQTIYEALACGSFLILGNLPQYAGMVEEGVTTRLVPPSDSNEVAAALAWVAARPKVRARVAQVGRAYMQQHADRRVQTQLVNQLYAELLASRYSVKG